MATIKKFEHLFSWQKARELTKYVYSLTKKSELSKDYGLKDQIQRSSVSVMANQAEGFTRGTKLELINYFYIAKGSAGEVQSHLYACLDAGYISESEFQKAYGLAEESQKLIQHFVDRVKADGRKGIQYKDKQSNKKDFLREIMEKRNQVFTEQGVMKKQDAEEKKLKWWI